MRKNNYNYITVPQIEIILYLQSQSPVGHDFRYVALKVNGYSMEPLLEEDDIVVIDRGDCDLKKIHENSIYALRKDDLYYIKDLLYEEEKARYTSLLVQVLILPRNMGLNISI